MANQALLVNPRRRRRAATRKKARRRPARRRPAARRAAPRRRRPARRRNPIGPYARNPRRRRRRSGVGMYVSNPRRRKARSRRRYRRNPTIKGIINSLVMPAASAAGGALALDFLWSYVPIPPAIKDGPMRHVAKGLGAVVLGQLVGMVGNKRLGDTMAMGALTVTFHNAFKEMAAQYMPNVNLSGVGYYSAGANAGYDSGLGGVGYYVQSPRLAVSRGESHPAANSELGYYVQEGVGQQY